MTLSSKSKKIVQLHIMHSWGGGLERWVHDYSSVDQERINLVLKSLGVPGTPGQRIALYQDILAPEPIKVWKLSPYIYNTAIAHLEYCYLIEEIIEQYQVSAILVSSLIGHSLDILNTGIKTIIIFHDYYPFCPAINIYFHQICSRCSINDLKECSESNPYNRFLAISSPENWEKLRFYFQNLVIKNKLPLVAPSQSVEKHLISLDSKFQSANFTIIPHGINFKNSYQYIPTQKYKSKLKILILGNLSLHKGLYLLKKVASKLSDIADFLLLGYGEEGSQLTEIKGIYPVAKTYRRENLPKKIEKIAPDLGLLLSVWPETFNYTLSELMMMGIPTMTTNVGSFSERIQDQVNGFLVPPQEAAIIAKIRELYQKQEMIWQVAEQLRSQSHKSLEEMREDYEQVLQSQQTEKLHISREINLVERLSLPLKSSNSHSEEAAALRQQIEAMESSKFWKLRKAWFQLKKAIGLPIRE